MSESGHEHLLNQLRDVHALEFHAQRQLSRLADRADDDDLRDICCQHLEQTQKHEQRMKELVEAQGRDPSPVAGIMQEFEPLMRAGRLQEAEAVLRKGALGSEQLLAEVGAVMAAAGRVG